MNTDYQQYDLSENRVTNIGDRMQKKLAAIPLPDLRHLNVMDVGCDGGFWCWIAKQKGAKKVLGLDRNRSVNGVHTDLISENRHVVETHGWLNGCLFEQINLGKQWRDFGVFDVIFMFSMYHHVYENCGDHSSIWFWLSRHVNKHSLILWEGPLNSDDTVVQLNVTKPYSKDDILAAASEFFEFVHVGPALHEPTREVYAFRPVSCETVKIAGKVETGAGGATKAFLHNDKARIKAIKNVLDIECFPGSLNVSLETPFDWTTGYYRAEIPDLIDRRKTINGEWKNRWARFYPVKANGIPCYVFRFEGESYPTNFIELISDQYLRDHIASKVEIEC